MGDLPQSNQRGIETPDGVVFMKTDTVGLNRTSVGLKRKHSCLIRESQNGPQSNQRGIETCLVLRRRALLGIGLNRTSVGLKRDMRGRVGGEILASIEPAWD